jgi:hypothetical protein
VVEHGRAYSYMLNASANTVHELSLDDMSCGFELGTFQIFPSLIIFWYRYLIRIWVELYIPVWILLFLCVCIVGGIEFPCYDCGSSG